MIEAPRHLPQRWKLFWLQLYADAQAYLPIDEFYTEDAELSATLATKTAMQGCRSRPGLPPLGDLTDLTSPTGTFLSIDYACPRGQVWREDGRASGNRKIPLIWSRSARALLVLPQLTVGECNLPPVQADSRVLERWTQGRRRGRCSSRLPSLPRVRLSHCYPAVAISYRSDKFNERGKMTEYIHHFDSQGVRLWMDRPSNPTVMLIQGGRLRIETHGIAG